MPELLGERDLRRRSHDAVDVEDGVDDILQVLVGAGDDAAMEVSRAGCRMRLEHLGDAGEMRCDIDQTSLGDLERHERKYVVTERTEVEVGAEARDDPTRAQ